MSIAWFLVRVFNKAYSKQSRQVYTWKGWLPAQQRVLRRVKMTCGALGEKIWHGRWGSCSQYSGFCQRVVKDRILDSGEYKSYIRGIGSLRETWAHQHKFLNRSEIALLRVKIKMRSVDLVEPPQQIFRCPIHIVAARIVREIISQGWTTKLLFEEVDLIEEQYYACPHKPSGVYNWIKQDQTFHHPILQVFISHVPYLTNKKMVPDYSPPEAPGHIRSEPRKIWWK